MLNLQKDSIPVFVSERRHDENGKTGIAQMLCRTDNKGDQRMNTKQKQMKKLVKVLQGKPKFFAIWGLIFAAIGLVLDKMIKTRLDFSGLLSSAKYLILLAGICAVVNFILRALIKDEEREEKDYES